MTNNSFSPKVKILAVCSQNEWRSPTAEHIYRGDPRADVRSAGTSNIARHTITQKDVDWADHILVMEPEHREQIGMKFGRKYYRKIKILNILVSYQYMDPELVMLLKTEIENILEPQN